MIQLKEADILNRRIYHLAETILKENTITFLHTHEFYELFLVTAGNLVHTINGREVMMSAGTLCLVRPEDVHQYRKGECQQTHFVNLAFSRDTFDRALSVYANYSSTDKGIFQTERMVLLPVRLSQALLGKLTCLSGDAAELFQVSREEVLMGILLDSFSYLGNSSCDRTWAPQWLVDTCEAMRHTENYLEGLPRFVALSGKSQEHLTRCMKKYFGITPSGYLNGIRLDAAALLLKTTTYTVIDILEECGFNNVSHFNKLFKNVYGISPIRYRQLNHMVINPV